MPAVYHILLVRQPQRQFRLQSLWLAVLLNLLFEHLHWLLPFSILRLFVGLTFQFPIRYLSQK